MRLLSAPKNTPLSIVKIEDAPYKAKLYELGIFEGQIIHWELSAAFSGPIAIRVNESLISLRKEDAGIIHVEKVES